MRPTLIALLLFPALARAQPAPDFDTAIAPLLSRHCLSCHEGAKPKGGLDLATRDGTMKGGTSGLVVVPGKPGESLLWKHVDKGHMPPKKPLPDAEKALLKSWIAAGAAWGKGPIDSFRFATDGRAGYDWWSLQPVRRPALPAVKDKGWATNAIDRFVLAALEDKNLAPSPATDRRTLIRRATFDLTGLPPTPADADLFLKDARPDAYERLVERLLASPQYGERWARHWLDVVRFGESNGFEHDELRKNAWPYRDWVIAALNRDMPYDEFARLQLAGDVLRPDDPSAAVATGFLVAGGYDLVGQKQQSAAMRAVVRQDELEDIAGTVSQTFLGLTVHCARCHDHKFDPVRQSEYYRLTAALAGVRHGERDVTSASARQEFERARAQAQARLAEIAAERSAVEKPTRDRILAARKLKAKDPPRPVARWDFTKGLTDELGGWHAALHDGAKLMPEGLQLSGKKGYAATGPVTKDLKARTLTALVKLANLSQRGGGVLTLQTLDGAVFDAIVFGEQQPAQWLAGSDFFRRSRPLQGPEETTLGQIHIAIVYAADGTITAYRDGQPHGQAYRSGGLVEFAAGKAQVLFGLRHGPAGGNKHLAGTIVRAEVHDRALTADEVAASAGHAQIAAAQIVAELTPDEAARHKRIVAEIAKWQAAAAPAPALTYACVPQTAEVTHVLLRGEPGRKGAVVSPGGVASLTGPRADFGLPTDAPDAERRKSLAAYITDPKNPLFPRVLVNRLWQHHFGAGLVETASDFGFNGGRPSHPELLDWLAAELIEPTATAGRPKPPAWSMKHIHRLLVMSNTYKQQSRFVPAAAKLDAGNRLMWRKVPLRLEAEAVRDAILQVAGQLNPQMGGPGYQDFKVTVRGATYYYEPIDAVGPEFYRRSIYRTWARSGRNRLLDNLDCPDPSTVTPRRTLTNTPLQALAMLNNAFVLRMADHFAERLRKTSDDVETQIDTACRLALARPATREEIASMREVVRAHGLSVLCRALFNSNEFLYVD